VADETEQVAVEESTRPEEQSADATAAEPEQPAAQQPEAAESQEEQPDAAPAAAEEQAGKEETEEAADEESEDDLDEDGLSDADREALAQLEEAARMEAAATADTAQSGADPGAEDGSGGEVSGGSEKGAQVSLVPVMLCMGIGIALVLATTLVLSFRYQAAQQTLLTSLERSIDQVAGKLADAQAVAQPQPAETKSSEEAFDDYTRLIETAGSYFRSGQFREARRLYRSVIELFPAGSLSDQAHYHLGLCFLKADDTENALNHFRTVTTRFSGSRYFGRSALMMSELLMRKGNFVQARRILYLILGARDRLNSEEQEGVAQAYYALARCLEREADAIEAIRPDEAFVSDLSLK